MTDRDLNFPLPGEKPELEGGAVFTPSFSGDGLLTCVTVSAVDGDVLMVAHMNAEALSMTLKTEVMHYWSRSRGELWKKGETSGQVQRLVELRTDCDQDALVARVDVGGDGGACHVGFRSCFYRSVAFDGASGTVSLVTADTKLTR